MSPNGLEAEQTRDEGCAAPGSMRKPRSLVLAHKLRPLRDRFSDARIGTVGVPRGERGSSGPCMGENPGTGDAEPLRASCNQWPDRSTTSTRPSAEIRGCPDFVRSIPIGTLCTVERSCCQALVQPLV